MILKTSSLLRSAVQPRQWLRYTSTVAPLEASRLIVEKTNNPKPKLPKDKLVFGKTFTDHMLEIEWTKEKG